MMTISHNHWQLSSMTFQDRRSREFARRGQDILAAALSLFGSDGWEDVTVDQIAQKSEVGKGTIYKHFASKDEIYARLAMDFQRRIVAGQAGIDPTLPVIERFRQYLRVAWEVHLSSKELHRVFLYCSRTEFRARLVPAVLAELQEVEAGASLATQTLILEGIEQGVFPRKPPALLLFGAQAAFWGGVQLVWSGYLGDIDRAQYLDELSQFLLAGLIYNDRQIVVASSPRAAVSVP